MTQRTLSWMAAALLGLASNTAAALESGFYIGAVGGNASIDISKREFDAFERDPLASNFTSSFNDSDTAKGLVLGGQFGRWFAVEAQLIDLGEYTYKSSQRVVNYFASAPRDLDVRSRTSFEAAAVTLSGILTVPVGEQVAFGFRLGLSSTAMETKSSYQERRGNGVYYSDYYDNDADATDIDATFGVSVEWAPIRHLGVRLEYQRLNQVGAEDDEYDYNYDYDDDYYDYYDGEEEHGGSDVDLLSLSVIARF